MRLFRHARLLLLALVISLVPAVSHAGVFISVGFAPPVMPVYVQPPCPQPGWMWTPGYWAYGPDGYYWVPGEWVPAPYVGALWTPGYWGWGSGFYVWHPGYWGPHVGYYGGINYGFGYFGIGFVGGMWHGRDFAYNTAVVNVNRTVIRNVYVNRTVIDRYTVARGSHVAFSGGRGGIDHPPTAEERAAEHEQHISRTSFQTEHVNTAMHDHNAYARVNGGHPHNLVAEHPMNQGRSEQQYHAAPQQHYEQRAQPQQHYEQRAQPQQHFEQRAQPQQHYEQRAQPQQHYEQRAQPQQHYEQRAQPQQHYEQRAQPQHEQHGESRPPHEDHGHR